MLLRLGNAPWCWIPVEVRYRGSGGSLVELQRVGRRSSFCRERAPRREKARRDCRCLMRLSEQILFSTSAVEVMTLLQARTTQLEHHVAAGRRSPPAFE